MGIDEIILRKNNDGKERGEGSSGPPTLRGKRRGAVSKRDQHGVVRGMKARRKIYFKKEEMVKCVKHCLKVK